MVCKSSPPGIEDAMATVKSVVEELRTKGKEKTRAIYVRHGMPADGRTLGVSTADMKLAAKKLRGEQALAMELYATGIFEARYLAGMLADGGKMTRKELDAWAEGAAGMPMIAEYAVPWVAIENAAGRECAAQWIDSKKEHVAAAGWSTWAGLVATRPDEELDLAEIKKLLGRVVKEIHGAKNRARYTMNVFVISVGGYVKALLGEAKAAAAKIGDVSVDVGETACQVPVAAAYIAKIEKMGRVGKKRKTMRC
jgi:3-methyladenine DNA glycosylase AlkD